MFSNIFKTKWPKSEEKLNFVGRWVWVPMIPPPPPQSKIRGDAPGCRLRPAEPGKVHLASGTGASVGRLCTKIMKEKICIHVKIKSMQSSFMTLRESFCWCACARCQIMDLFGLCWTDVATCSMVTCCLVVDFPWWLTFIHCPQITKLVDSFMYQLTPRGKFQLPMFQIEVRQELPPSFLQWCGQNACLDTKRIFLDISHCLAPSLLASVLPPSVLPLYKKIINLARAV